MTLGEITVKYYGFITLVFFMFYRDPKKSKIYKIASITATISEFEIFKIQIGKYKFIFFI